MGIKRKRKRNRELIHRFQISLTEKTVQSKKKYKRKRKHKNHERN